MAVATAVVAYDDAELLDIACVTTTLATATRFLTGEHTAHSDAPPDTTSDRAGYDIRLLTVGGRPVTARPSGWANRSAKSRGVPALPRGYGQYAASPRSSRA
jgi:hypothetical protein